MSSPELSPPPQLGPAAKTGQLVLGVLSIFAGILLGLLMVRALMLLTTSGTAKSAWNVGGTLVFCLVAIFLVWVGTRAIRRSRGQIVPRPRVKWGRALAGVWLIFFASKSHFAPDARAYQADNETQAFGMMAANMLMIATGVFLIAHSLKPMLQGRTPKSAQ